jgi:hypothetical protein
MNDEYEVRKDEGESGVGITLSSFKNTKGTDESLSTIHMPSHHMHCEGI